MRTLFHEPKVREGPKVECAGYDSVQVFPYLVQAAEDRHFDMVLR